MRIRIGVAVLVGLVALIVVGLTGFRGSPVDLGGIRAERDLLADKVRSLEEKLKKTELAAAASETGVNRSESTRSVKLGTSASGPEPLESEPPSGARGQRVVEPAGQVPATEDQGAAPVREIGSAPAGIGSEPAPASEVESPAGDRGTHRAATEKSRTIPPGEEKIAAASQPRSLMSFDAQGVTAFSEGANHGILRFRLVKDQPKVRFSGYLFVFVQMVDKRGENKIYAYPRRTRLGEADLPTDYRKGESVSFKFNSSVELPYKDIRPGARLAGITILLYGEDGRIVYQRGFSRAELKRVSGKATRVNGVQTKAKGKRRAL
jgi:hypothetical protein